MLGSNQRVGDLRKCQFLNGHQHFLIGRIDLSDQLFLEVVAVTPVAVQRIAVPPAVSMIEVQLEVLRQGQISDACSHHLACLAAAQQHWCQQGQ
ncbi:MAG: Uncharacterised protein [Synechococcus sp. MIT S9220]|nr:MAG: Uncharacterised protein [Synechococcus sp. MIT S9220]